MAKLDIVVVSDGKSLDGFYFLQGVLNVDEEYATGVANMVERVLALAKSGDTITGLTIHGHGNEEGQYVGSNWLSAATLPLYRESLAKLTPKFDKKAAVTLGGCNVGYAEALLQQLSELWEGVIVRAGTAQQLAFPGIEGGVTSCKVKICTYGGPGFWDKFDRSIRRDTRFLK
jgi:hypothetical protein